MPQDIFKQREQALEGYDARQRELATTHLIAQVGMDEANRIIHALGNDHTQAVIDGIVAQRGVLAAAGKLFGADGKLKTVEQQVDGKTVRVLAPEAHIDIRALPGQGHAAAYTPNSGGHAANLGDRSGRRPGE